MGKSLERYRDESREEFGEADIEAAFPVWLIDINGQRRRLTRSDKIGIAVMSTLGVFGMFLSFAANLALIVIAALRGRSRQRAPHERREMNHDVGQARIIFRPGHIHVHHAPADHGVGGRVADVATDETVSIGPDDSGLRRTVVQIGEVRWALRSKHEPALRRLLDARGVRVEPLD